MPRTSFNRHDAYLVQHIGSTHGRIAVWCTETQAIDLAYLHHSSDGFRDELLQAVERAYPKPDEEGA